MEKAILCLGSYAKIPYCFDNLGIRVYSVEELCYVIKENAFLLDREMMDKKLVKWIEAELKLSELANMLYPLLRQRTSVGVFAGTILDYVKLYDAPTIHRVEEIFRTGANLNAYEKLKSRVDYMVENGKFTAAIVEYDELLRQLPEGETELTAKIYHNKAVALCGLFMFAEASEFFRKSYELEPEHGVLVEYLGAKRLSMEEDEYIAFAAGYPEYYEETLELERRVNYAKEHFNESDRMEDIRLNRLRKENGETVRYYETMELRVQELKNRYRQSM